MSTGPSVRTVAARADQKQQTRREILNSARRVLAMNGFHRTKIADIARDAGVAVGTFYLYYPTKEALFLELVEDTVTILQAEIERVRSDASDPRSRARATCETFFRFAHQNRELFRIVFGHGATFHDVVRRAQRLFVVDIAANLAEGMRTGVFRDNDPNVLAQAFVGMSLQVVSWWIEEEDIPLSRVTDSVMDFVFHGISTSPASTP